MRTVITTTALIAFAVAGCNSAKPGTSGNAAAPGGANAVPPAAAETARDFLAKLVGSDTKAALDSVAVSFRKDVSGPLTFEEEKKLGYSNPDTEKYLREAAAGAEKPEITRQQPSPSGGEVSFRGSLGGKEPKLFSLRMAKEADAWKVTRFIAGRVPGSGFPTDPGTPELAWARETALDFLDSLIGSSDEHLLTAHLVTEDLKAHLPAPSVADPGLKYAKKDVRDWLNKVRQGVSGYTINTQALGHDGAAFTGDLAGPGKSQQFSLLLVKHGEQWKVDHFDVKGEPRP